MTNGLFFLIGVECFNRCKQRVEPYPPLLLKLIGSSAYNSLAGFSCRLNQQII